MSRYSIDEQSQRNSWGMLAWLGLSVMIFALDQGTKAWASADLALHRPIEMLPFFNFTLAHNYGAAFSFLAGSGGWQRWFFTIVALVVSVVLCVWLKRLKKHELWVAIAIACILGGALGNVYDRILLGYVVDFLDFHWSGNHFPIFNIADSAICIGAFMMIIDTFKTPAKTDDKN